MKRYITLLGAWTVIFPINLLTTLSVVAIQLIIKVFNMPLDIWDELDKQLNNIHTKDD